MSSKKMIHYQKLGFIFIIIILLNFILTSCKNNFDNEPIVSNILDISDINYKKDTVYLSDIADGIEYIKLETDSSFFIAGN